MTTNSADRGAVEGYRAQVPVEELARQQGVRPVESADQLVRDDIWESDEELDAFLADLHALRHSDLSA